MRRHCNRSIQQKLKILKSTDCCLENIWSVNDLSQLLDCLPTANERKFSLEQRRSAMWCINVTMMTTAAYLWLWRRKLKKVRCLFIRIRKFTTRWSDTFKQFDDALNFSPKLCQIWYRLALKIHCSNLKTLNTWFDDCPGIGYNFVDSRNTTMSHTWICA